MDSRFGGKAVRPLGQQLLSLSRRSATAPLFARRGESKAFRACMFKVGASRQIRPLRMGRQPRPS